MQHYLKPVALAASIAFALTACSKHEAPAPAASPAPVVTTAPATTATVASAASAADAAKSIFDISELDPTLKACQDFDGYVNAKWIAANPIPSDRSRWGAFDQLAEASLNTQHEIVEAAAKGESTAKPGSIEQKIGEIYKSGMDEAAIEKAGFAPIQPKLDAIAGLKNGSDVADYITNSFVDGDMQVFAFGAGADFKHADMQIGYAFQNGLGLPTKDYYLDPKHADERAAYVAYITKALELTGVSAADAKTQADQVLAFETELAKASLAPVELRTPENQYHFVSVKQADKVTPHFNWEKFFTAQGLTIDKGFSLS
ncbi:MAG: M13 family metallopeptidase N-terminal domain-containing protein, partial [Rhodanobacter sp.]